MHPILRNILGVIIGLFVGGGINMAIIIFGTMLIPGPEGMIAGDPDSVQAHAHLFRSHHIIVPLLAHGLGTLVGAFLAAMIGASRKMILAMIVGAFFLVGGIMMAQYPFPMWMKVVDLVVAYIPMAWLGGRLGGVGRAVN